jgi:T5SS/PEP-CTERM-associated repeat protein/autotransporter-associated beta strand protein
VSKQSQNSGRNFGAAAKLSPGRRVATARLSVFLASAALFMTARLPAAAAATWTGASSVDWFDPTNWSPPATPDSTTNVVIDQGIPNANPSIGINATSNAAASAEVEIGDATATTGLVTLRTTNAHPASWTIGGSLLLGESGTGTINISNGASLINITGSQTQIGANSGGVGTLTIDGVGSLWNEQNSSSGSIPSGPIVVGASGTGFLTITHGAEVETTGDTGHFVIGSNVGGVGTVTVGSAGSPNLANPSTLINNPGVNNPGELWVGYFGTGTLTINSDGAVSGFSGVEIGSQTGGQGTVIVNGGTLDSTGGLFVGDFGLGTLTIQNGGTVTSATGTIAGQAGSAGSSVTVTGTNSTWNIGAGSLTVGNSDTGSLSILAGGAVIVSPGAQINIGDTTGVNGTGTVLVDNGTLRANGSFIAVGELGNPGSTLTVQNGGLVVSDGGIIGGGGFGFSSTGVVTVAGAGSLWDAARDASGNVDAFSIFLIDNAVSMTGLVIKQGGQVIDGFGFVGDSGLNGVVNTVTVDGPGSKWTNLTQLSVGFADPGFFPGGSTGIIDITGGGQVSAPSISIGLVPDGNGANIDRISVNGAGSNLQATGGTIVVGQFGTGALSVTTGAAVADANGIIGYSSATPGSLTLQGSLFDTNNVGANSVGTVIVTGPGSSWSNSASLIVGDNATTDPNFTGIGGGTATATLTVADGGVVSVNGGAGTINVAVNAGATGTINIGAAKGAAAVAPGAISAAEILFGAGTGSIVFNHTSANYSFGASIQGAGTVDVESGTTVLTAVSSYTGATTVNGGTLAVDGSIATSNVTVNAGGTLGGNGTVGNTVINGGTLAPGSVAGSAFGPLTVQGNLSFTAASTYMIQVTPANAGRTNVTGTATLNGATVDANFAAGAYVSKQYTILNATGGVTGTFGSLVNTNLPASVSASLSYDALDAFLNLKVNFAIPGGLNVNQQNVANALTNFFNANGGIPLVFAALTPAGLTQASGELATGSQQTTFDAMNMFMGAMTDPFFAGHGDVAAAGPGATPFAEPSDSAAYAGDGKPRSKRERDAYAAIYRKAPVADSFAQRWSVWAAGYGGSQTTDGNAALGSNSATSRIFGTAVGADYRFSPFTLAGFALAGGGTNFSVNGLGSGRSDLFQAGAYVRHTVGPAYITAALAYGWQDITTDRFVTIAGVDHLRAEFNANAFSGRLEGGYRLVTPWMGVTPYAAAQFTTFDLPAYAEAAVSGANTFALAYGAKDVTDSRSELGVRTDRSWAMTDSIFTLRGRAAWVHDYNPNRSIGATFQALPGASFVVNGAAQASDGALVTASAEIKWINGWSAAATFEGEFSNVTRSYAGKAVVRYSW